MNRSGHAFKRSISRRLTFLAAVSIVGLTGIATAWASSTTEVSTAKKRGVRILVQQKGYTLYAYCSGASDSCTKGHSASMWPAMIAYHKPVAGTDVNAKKLGTRTINGHKVVTYYGDPLYRYDGDKKPGQSNGEGKNGTWYVVSQFGQPITPSGY